MDELLFTPAAVLELLAEIPELNGIDLSLNESNDSIQLTIGVNTYNILTHNALDCQVDAEVVEAVSDEADAAIAELSQRDDVVIDDQGVIEGGLLSGLVKSVLLGGMIRLAPKLMI